MDIAVYFERIDLGNGIFSFMPLSIIRGKYDKDTNHFETDYGIICEYIHGSNAEYYDYFGFPTNLEELKSAFGHIDSEEALLSEYFNACSEGIFIGSFDYSYNCIKTLQIDFDELEEYLSEISDNTEYNFNEDSESMINVDLNFLFDLRNSQSLEEVQNKLDSIIDLAKGLFIFEDNSKPKTNNIPEILEDVSFDFGKTTPYDILQIEKKKYRKKELLEILKEKIKKLKDSGVPQETLVGEIDVLLDAYNKLYNPVKKQRQTQKTKNLKKNI